MSGKIQPNRGKNRRTPSPAAIQEALAAIFDVIGADGPICDDGAAYRTDRPLIVAKCDDREHIPNNPTLIVANRDDGAVTDR